MEPELSSTARHTSFADRACSESISPLARYLLSLISIKQSNLCVSADVHTTDELLQVAEDVGNYICILKTHADTIDDFSERTIRGLQDLSRRKHFLIFEDRKFGDIGNTLQSQYTRGPLRIAQWAHLTNAHLLPGPTIIPALRSASHDALTHLNQSVATIISSGNSIPPTTDDADFANAPSTNNQQNDGVMLRHHRTNSLTATATTTITQTVESISPPPPPSLLKTLSQSEDDPTDLSALAELGPPPHARGLLLLAQMSSSGNLCTAEYTAACVDAARKNGDFVLGFISQQHLGSGEDFLSFCPGVGLPKQGAESMTGDGRGQVWRTPDEVIGKDGVDVVIVGRGILNAEDKRLEAERYRKCAWAAYERNVGRSRMGLKP